MRLMLKPVLNGQETKTQLIALGEDIFRYFGLGCRNVSKLFVPKGYSFTAFFASSSTRDPLNENFKQLLLSTLQRLI